MDKRKNSKNDVNNDTLGHLDFNSANTTSSTDFTGLIPTEPKSDDEKGAYMDLYKLQVKKEK